MARIARQVAPGYVHHVVQQGAGGKPVFPDDDARVQYIELLRETAAELNVEIIAWALLRDRVHLALRPSDADGLAMTLRRTHSSYGRSLNARLGGSGTVWGDRFASCPVDHDWFYATVKYVERAPLLTGEVRRADTYRWSSAPAHCGKRTAIILGTDWPTAAEKRNWSAWLAEPQPDDEIAAIELATSRGTALGDSRIVGKKRR